MPEVQRPRADEEDDLDDLDDVLDQFSAPTLTSARASTSQPSQQPQPPQTTADEALTEEWATDLAREMESLLRKSGVGEAGLSDRKQLAAAWEAALVEGMNGMPNPSTSSASTSAAASSSSKPSEASTDFRSRIRSTVDRLRDSELDLHPPDLSAGGAPGSLESLLSRFTEMGEDEENIHGLLEEMMGQLMSKDVLYEPLKELHEKFPVYLSEHASTISPEDRGRYEAQIAYIKRLIEAFEASTYRDDDEISRKTIVELMGELQTHGQPPEEIMGPLPPGFSMGTDGLPEMPDGCNMN